MTERIASIAGVINSDNRLDISRSLYELRMTDVRTIFVDNSATTTNLTIVGMPLQIKQVISGNTQAFIPVFCVADVLNLSVYGAIGAPVILTLIAERIPQSSWSTLASGVIQNTVSISGNVVTTSSASACYNRSGSLATGGVSQQICPSNQNRKRFFIQNPTDETGQGVANREPLYVNFGGAANVNDGISIELQPGAFLELNGNGIYTDAVFVIAASSGHKFIAREGA